MQTLQTYEENDVLYVALNRPDKRNAFNPEMIKDLTAIFKDAPTRPNVRLIEISGKGKSFCAGADLGWMQSMAKFTMDQNLADSNELFSMFEAGFNCPVPIITYVHGHVMGGATGLAAISDVVFAEEQTKFAFSEVRLGLVPAVISPFILARMHAAKAQRYMLTGEVFSADDALAGGLIHFVGNQEHALLEKEKAKKSILASGPEAVKATKNLIKHVAIRSGDWKSLRQLTTKVIAEKRVGAEGQEGLKSFFEKRLPNWSP